MVVVDVPGTAPLDALVDAALLSEDECATVIPGYPTTPPTSTI